MATQVLVGRRVKAQSALRGCESIGWLCCVCCKGIRVMVGVALACGVKGECCKKQDLLKQVGTLKGVIQHREKDW